MPTPTVRSGGILPGGGPAALRPSPLPDPFSAPLGRSLFFGEPYTLGAMFEWMRLIAEDQYLRRLCYAKATAWSGGGPRR